MFSMKKISTVKKGISLALVLITVLGTLAFSVYAAYENTHRNTGDQRTDIVEVAKSQLGYREGKNNDTKYGTWYGMPNQPWCAMFVSWCARQAGIPKSVIPNLSYVPNYFSNKAFTIKKSNYTPKSGDIFLTKSQSHVGLVWYTDGSYFYTIEGNSNNNGSSEGTSVVTNKRRISDFCFAVPSYTSNKSSYMLDLNGCLDGVTKGNISGIATADVYINGTRVANDCTDFYQSVKVGSTYTIKDIRTKSGYIYNGSSSISGKVNGDVKVNLSLSTKVTYSTTNFKMKSGTYTNAYTSSSLATKTGRIYTGDVITIDRIYSNGVVRLSCPWDNGSNKIVYARASELKFKATKYIDAFSAVNGSKVGRVYPNDLVTVIEIYSSGWMKCSCPWNGNGNKTIYIKTSAIY